MRSREVIEDFIRTLDWNIVFGNGDEQVLIARRDALLAEYAAIPPLEHSASV